jgi:transcriptional regulator with XRE-family HTH domain
MHMLERFGDQVRDLRQGRGLTQESLAARSQVSADAIRRIESGASSPSLETLHKLSLGLGVRLGTLFAAYERGGRDMAAEMCDLMETREPREVGKALRVLKALFGPRRRSEAGGPTGT